MNFWKDEQLNELYQREQLDRAQKARDARTNPEQESQNDFWSLFTRKNTR